MLIRLFLEPIVLLATNSLKDSDKLIFEFKLYGFRAIAFKREAKVQLRSGNDKDFNSRSPAIGSEEWAGGVWGLTRAKMREFRWLMPALVA